MPYLWDSLPRKEKEGKDVGWEVDITFHFSFYIARQQVFPIWDLLQLCDSIICAITLLLFVEVYRVKVLKFGQS